ncbi:MAG: YajQ family cyclic di-GMP-binding protein [Candidatus Saccharimonadales bacterium]
MATFSFDIVSEYDKAEVNNVFQAVAREIGNRYDLKGTPAAIDWLGDKTGFVVTAANDMHLQSIEDIIRRCVIARGQSTKLLDLTHEPVQGSMKLTREIPFVSGLDGEKARSVSKLIRDELPKLKSTIQGDAVRVSSSSKDELQRAMQLVRGHDFDFPINFTNYR